MMETCVHLKFFVLESQRIHEHLVYDWLLDQAKELDLRGGSVFRAIAGYGRRGIRHDANFVELAGQLTPEVVFVASREDARRLVNRVRAEDLPLFHCLPPADCAMTGCATA